MLKAASNGVLVLLIAVCGALAASCGPTEATLPELVVTLTEEEIRQQLVANQAYKDRQAWERAMVFMAERDQILIAFGRTIERIEREPLRRCLLAFDMAETSAERDTAILNFDSDPTVIRAKVLHEEALSRLRQARATLGYETSRDSDPSRLVPDCRAITGWH